MKSRGKKLITAGVGVIVVGLLLFFYFNIGNPEWKCYRNYLPKQSSLKAISFSFPKVGMEAEQSWDTDESEGVAEARWKKNSVLGKAILDKEELEIGYELAEYLVKNALYADDENVYQFKDSKEDEMNIKVCYRLKNGRKVYRNYYVPYSDEMISAAEKVYATESYKKAIFPLHKLEMKTPYFVSMGMVSETCILSDEEAEELIDLYIKDVADLTMKQTLQEAPDMVFGLGNLDGKVVCKYPIYEDFENTLAFLAEREIYNKLNWDKVENMHWEVIYKEKKGLSYHFLGTEELVEQCNRMEVLQWGGRKYRLEEYESEFTNPLNYEIEAHFTYKGKAEYEKWSMKAVPDWLAEDIEKF